MKLEISRGDDRLTVATILIKNGYTVRQVRERKQPEKKYTYFLNAEKNEKRDE